MRIYPHTLLSDVINHIDKDEEQALLRSKSIMQSLQFSIMKTKSVGLIPITTIRQTFSTPLLWAATCLLMMAGSLTASPDEWPAMSFYTPDDLTQEISTPGLLAPPPQAMSCRPAVQVSLNHLGYAVVTPSMLVKAPAYPWDEYEVDLMGPLDDTVFCAQIGEELMAVVEEIPTGNTCMSTLTVEDKLPPTLSCTDDTVKCTVDIPSLDFLSFIDTVYDNCSEEVELSYVYAVTEFDCDPSGMAGKIDLTVTATDENGFSSTCTQVIWLEKFTLDDVVFPPDTILGCVDPDTSIASVGQPTIGGEPIDHFCELVSWRMQTVYDLCSGEWKVARLWSVMDWCTGETINHMQSILIKDTFPPEIDCPEDATLGTDPGDCFRIYEFPDVDVTDVCSDDDLIDVTFTVSTVPGIFEIGEEVQLDTGSHLITVTAIDDCLTTGSCTYTITVVDDEAPVLVCHDYTTNLNAVGMSILQAESAQFFASDNCEVDSIAVRKMTDKCGEPGNLLFGPFVTFCCEEAGDTVMVVFQAFDAAGNENQCMIEVIVKDATPPDAQCKDIMVFLNEFGMAMITPGDIDNGSSDNCGIVDTMLSREMFACADLETNPNEVVLKLTDPSGNMSTCTSQVTVKDTIPPTAICQDITVTLDPETMMVSIEPIDVDGGSFDNCIIMSRTIDKDKFSCEDVGPNNEVKLIIMDQSGNLDSCIANVYVMDNPPVVECKDATLCLDSTGMVEVTQEDIDEVMDDCGDVTVEIVPNMLSCDNIGDNVVTLTVTDIHGNTASCTSTVTIEDCLAPMCTTIDITVELDENGEYTLANDEVDGGSTDECGIESITVTPTDLDCGDAGQDVIVTQTVTDVNGNVSMCTATVTVIDNNEPECNTMDITVYLDENGMAEIDSNGVDDGSSNACGVESIRVSPSSFDCSQAGTDVVVTQTVTGVNGIMVQCTALVTVLDTIAPECLTEDITVFLDEDGLASIDDEAVDDDSFDNCEIESIVLDPKDFDCDDVGTVEVTQTVTDVNGNVSTCTAMVTVEDDIAPSCETMDITITLDDEGMASIDSNAVDDGSDDACGLESITLDQTEFDCSDGDSVIVTQTVTDVNGNTAECTATVFIDNPSGPMAICNDITVYLDEMGMVSITSDDIDGGSSANCGDVMVEIDIMDFDCDDTGDNTVILTVTDEADRTDTCHATVTVLDTLAPICVPNDLTVYLDDNGDASIEVGDVDGGTTDNCPFDLEATPLEFDCNDTGDNTVTLTATDESGNSSMCDATVTVLDTTPPVCIAITDTLQIVLTGTGMATIDPDDIDDGSFDNCGVITLDIDPSMFTCDDLGPNDVTLTVTDASGNTSECTAVVNVEDGDNFMAMCQDITIAVDENGEVTIVPGQIDDGSGGGCSTGELMFELSQTFFTCEDLGVNEVTLIVTDGEDTDSCTANVTVIDNMPPEIMCPADMTVECGTDISDPSMFGMATAEDNCDVESIDETNESDIDECGAGTLVRTFTATDGSGNTSSCIQTITLGATEDFDESNIDWPDDVTLEECSSTDPEDIPGGEPDIEIPDGSCALVSVSFSDEEMMTCDTLPDTPCLTIMRTWTVIDSCQLEDGTMNGIFTHVQTVVVDDNTGPEFAFTPDVTVEVDPETCTAFVNLTTSATSCGEMVDVTNDYNDGGADASDEYPIGLTIVTFTAEDECCNVSTLEVAVLVEDSGEATFTCTKPVVCMPPGGILTLPASIFILFTNPDGCLEKDDFYYSFSEGDPFDSLMSWTCADLGVPLVPIWIFDQSLNEVSMCNADLDLNDGSTDPEECETSECGNENLTIGGGVFTEDGAKLKGIPVAITNTAMPMAYTSTDGSYHFNDLSEGGNYVVAPLKDDQPLYGVSTLDLVAIQKHLLGLKPLTSPYQQIAADIISNGEISALDLVELRKMLLGYQSDFSQNTSWRFVDAHFEFPDPYNPFMIPFAEEMVVGELWHDMDDVDFVGVKIGDVNNTVSTLDGPDHDTQNGFAVALVYPDVDVEAGEVVKVPVSAVGFDNIVGYQFTLKYDGHAAEFKSLNIPEGSHLDHENFGYTRTANGEILVSWNQAVGTRVNEQDVLFELEFIARRVLVQPVVS